MTTFTSLLTRLSGRVDQILRYHLIDAHRRNREDRTPKAIIAHFATWPACEAMLETARKKKHRAISLWAGDARCLNDPLEGQALLKLARDRARPLTEEQDSGNPTTSRGIANRHTSPGGWPDSASHSVSTEIRAKDVQFWEDVHTLVDALFPPRPPSTPGAPFPYALPVTKVYLASFCNIEDALDLWRAYGDDGEGVSMVMPLHAAANAVKNSAWKFYRVMYREPEMRRAWILLAGPLREAWCESDKKPETKRNILDRISPVLHLYKHHQYETESEIRLVYDGRKKPTTKKVRGELRPILETAPFFLKGRCCKIILGPRTPSPIRRRIASLEVLLGGVFKRDVPQVQISNVPYQ